MQEGEFCYSMKEEHWSHVSHKTKEEAVAEGESEAKIYNIKKFFVGQVKKVELPTISAMCLLEDLREELMEEFGEAAEYALWANEEQEEELEERLNQVLSEWADKHSLNPELFTVENVEEAIV